MAALEARHGSVVAMAGTGAMAQATVGSAEMAVTVESWGAVAEVVELAEIPEWGTVPDNRGRMAVRVKVVRSRRNEPRVVRRTLMNPARSSEATVSRGDLRLRALEAWARRAGRIGGRV